MVLPTSTSSQRELAAAQRRKRHLEKAIEEEEECEKTSRQAKAHAERALREGAARRTLAERVRASEAASNRQVHFQQTQHLSQIQGTIQSLLVQVNRGTAAPPPGAVGGDPSAMPMAPLGPYGLYYAPVPAMGGAAAWEWSTVIARARR